MPTLPFLAARSRPAEFFTGLGVPLRAAGLMFKSGRLVLLSMVCAAVTAAALAASGWGAWSLGQSLAERWVGPGGTLSTVATVGLGVLLFVVLFAVAALTLPMLLLAPLQDPISEATELQLGDFSPPPFSMERLVRGLIESVAHTVLRLVLMVLGIAVLFPLNLVPGVGSALWWVTSTAWSMWWVAVEQLSNPMARHLMPFRSVLKAARGRFAYSMGLGAALYVLLWIPVLNFFLMPVAVVAATLSYRAFKQAGDLGPLPSREREG